MERAVTPQEAVNKAVSTAGGSSALAALIGGKVVRQNVDYWVEKGRVPAEHCPAIERAMRAKAQERGDQSLVVTCEELCPGVDWAVLREQAA